MYIKYEYIGDRTLLHLSPDKPWSLQFRMFDEDGNEDYSVYLTVSGGTPIQILDTDLFCQGCPDLPYYAVGHLYEDVIDAAAEQVSADPNVRVLDIPGIVDQLVASKYRDLWLTKGYIGPDWSWCQS
jgi:hypothetical protein